MTKFLIKLLVAVGITAGSFAAQAQNIPPNIGLPMCAGVYGTMSVYAQTPANKEILKQRGADILRVALRYNPQAGDMAINLARENVQAINAGNTAKADEVINAERGCRVYLKAYGL